MFTLASFLNLGGPDLIIILVIVLVLFGAKKLPELAKGMGQALKEFTKAKNEFENEVSKPVAEIMVQRPAEQQAHYAEQPRPAAQPEPAHEHVAPAHEHVAPAQEHVAPAQEHVAAEPAASTKTSA